MEAKKISVGMFIVFATMASMFAGSVTSASASELSGAVKGGPTVLEGGGATLECTSEEGKYEVVKPTNEKEPKWEEQEKSNPGKDLLINISKWSGCKVKTSEVKEAKPKIIKSCELHLQDEAPAGKKTSESKATMSVVSECVFTTTILFFNCNIKVPRSGNSELPEALLKNLEPEDLTINVALSGLTTTTSGVCPGATGSKASKLKGTWTAEGVIHL